MGFSENKITEKSLTDQTVSTHSQGKLFELQPVDNKRIEIGFNTQEVFSDGGLLLIRDIEQRIGIIKAITSCLVDTIVPLTGMHAVTVSSQQTRWG